MKLVEPGILVGLMFLLTDETHAANFSVTCDNEMTLYLNGVEVARNLEWTEVTTVEALRNTRVYAIQCVDLGAQFGILASGSDGLVTDLTWRCSPTEEDGWTLADFEDSHWETPTSFGTNGVSPWGSMTQINPSAQWIWTKDNSTRAYCRWKEQELTVTTTHGTRSIGTSIQVFGNFTNKMTTEPTTSPNLAVPTDGKKDVNYLYFILLLMLPIMVGAVFIYLRCCSSKNRSNRYQVSTKSTGASNDPGPQAGGADSHIFGGTKAHIQQRGLHVSMRTKDNQDEELYINVQHKGSDGRSDSPHSQTGPKTVPIKPKPTLIVNPSTTQGNQSPTFDDQGQYQGLEKVPGTTSPSAHAYEDLSFETSNDNKAGRPDTRSKGHGVADAGLDDQEVYQNAENFYVNHQAHF